MTLSNGFKKHSPEWIEFKGILAEEKTKLVTKLIHKDDDEVRGRIKMIDDILSLDKESQSGIQPVALDY